MAAEYGSLPQAARLRADLVRALDGSLDIPARLAERERAYARRARAVLAPPPRVSVAPGSSRTATVIEVRAQDAHGLLHRIGRALEQAGVAVRSAHISTLGANAVDAFYVTDDGRARRCPTARRHEVAARRGARPCGSGGARPAVAQEHSLAVPAPEQGRTGSLAQAGYPRSRPNPAPDPEDRRPPCSIRFPTAWRVLSKTSGARAA